MIKFFDIKPFRSESTDTIDFERRFVIPISLAGATFSLASILTNGVLNLDEIVQITPYISFIVYLVIFLWAWNNKNVTFAKYALILFTLILINFLWYFNYGANGPILYLFVLLYSYLIFMVKGKQLLLVTVLIALNLVILFYIEYNHPGIVRDYKTHHQQIVDVYMSMLFYGLIIFIMMYIAKISYVNAYLEAKKADKLKTAFLENMSHEIRTPLNAIVGFSNLLAEEGSTLDDRKVYVELINESNESLLRLVNDILDVSLIEANQVVLANNDVNINELLSNLYKTYQLVLEKKESAVRLILDCPKEQLHILGDRTRLRQIFINLLDNAVKFTSSGSITLGVKEQPQDLLLYVKDTGIGIDKKNHHLLFDRFFKVADKKDVLYRGTGIGLYLCKKITEMMGGTITVYSEINKGAEFQFTVPKKGFRKTLAKPNASKIISTAINKNIKVLVVEDHLSSQVYYSKLLKSLNIEVLIANNGKEGIEIVKKNSAINLILMDLKMPEMDGFEALEAIRKINADIPVVAQTAFAMEKDRERCLKAGFNGFVSKPVTKENLMVVLQESGLVS